jgi:hypothetical protein
MQKQGCNLRKQRVGRELPAQTLKTSPQYSLCYQVKILYYLKNTNTMAKVKIRISRNVQEVIEQAQLLINKHNTDAQASVLNALQDTNWTDVNTKVGNCLAHHLRAEELKRQMELAYRERDLLLMPITETVKASRDLLLGVFRANPKKLGDWGFKVSDKPAKLAPKETLAQSA